MQGVRGGGGGGGGATLLSDISQGRTDPPQTTYIRSISKNLRNVQQFSEQCLLQMQGRAQSVAIRQTDE
jgi:hypothetical protein